MKKVLLLLLFPFFILSCTNDSSITNEHEDIENEDIDDDDIDDDDMLTLRHITSVQSFSHLDYTRQTKKWYRASGQPALFERFLDNSSTDVYNTDKLFYNSNGTLDSTYSPGLEYLYSKYEYEDNRINIINYDSGSGIGVSSYYVEYNANTITVRAGNITSGSLITYTFSDENYDLLIREERLNSPLTNIYPHLIIEYEYDSNSNRTSKIYKLLNHTSLEHYVYYTETFTYDDKLNPYKNISTTDPVILHNFIGMTSEIQFDDKISPNNIISSTLTNSGGSNISTYEYEYNELNYPTSLIKTEVRYNNDGEEEMTITTTETFTYF
ncbi:hypothetical protein ACFS5M_00095 [Lacinutrix iliipiscaria]|uniref:YD repeat-containing protein n=1 Tax=Lacinutrix iliipiscaria TaxID=1230532 RepID=A0ABW5WHG7_9FLAO